jgi:hypothetical protein
MLIKTEITTLNEITEVFLLFGLATMFAAVCPIISFIVLVYNFIDIKSDLYIQMFYHARPLPEEINGIGPWLHVAEFCSIVTVVINSLLLYITSKDTAAAFERRFSLDEN